MNHYIIDQQTRDLILQLCNEGVKHIGGGAARVFVHIEDALAKPIGPEAIQPPAEPAPEGK